MKRNLRNLWKGTGCALLCVLVCMACLLAVPVRAAAGTNTDTSNPYLSVMILNDGTPAWTIRETCPEGELKPFGQFLGNNRPPSYWYPEGTTVTFRDVNKPVLLEGQHYYDYIVNGVVDIAYWKVTWRNGRCIHNKTGVQGLWHDTVMGSSEEGDKNCYHAYPSGWFAYCANCGEPVNSAYVYATKDAVSTIDRYDTGSAYYYHCWNPDCRNLENTGGLGHTCQQVSWNKYRVVYKVNTDDFYSGETPDTYHMYGHHTEYEGMPVDPVKNLSKGYFVRIGYSIKEWNTKPDGTGIGYVPGYEIPEDGSLTNENYNQKLGTGTVTLYAIWEETKSTLEVDPNGGAYLGNPSITSLVQGYGTSKQFTASDFTSPSGYVVSFKSNGGTACPAITQTMHFDHMERVNISTFAGRFNKVGDAFVYSYLGKNGITDRVKALYERDTVILPSPTRPGYSFGGWYEDAGFTKYAGGGGDEYTPPGNITLYAQWTKLVLDVTENYVANNKKGASDLEWSDENYVGKYYKIFRAREGQEFEEVIDAAGPEYEQAKSGVLYYATGGGQTFTVPANGIYLIEANGAAGSDYQSNSGGNGGYVSARFALKKGDVLQIMVGSSTYGGGGAGGAYGANGGGATKILLNGSYLLVAGGGGGATKGDNGKIGGASDGLRDDQAGVGASDASSTGGGGGGGGYVGGTAGNNIIHSHTDDCIQYHTHDAGCYTEVAHTHYCSRCAGGRHPEWQDEYHVADCGCTHVWWLYCGFEASGYNYCTHCGGREHMGNFCTGGFTRKNGMPACVCVDAWSNTPAKTVKLTCTKTYAEGSKGCPIGYICGMSDGQIIGRTGGFGGSSYINPSAMAQNAAAGSYSGKQGIAKVTLVGYGIAGQLGLDGVPSPDLAAPEKIDESSVVIEPIAADMCHVSFAMPYDKGTEYLWMVKSYSAETGTFIAQSNQCNDELITGIDSYRFTYDAVASHGEGYIAGLSAPGAYYTLSAPEHRNDGGTAVTEPKLLNVTRYPESRYIHIAAVDVAGNVGPTLDIAIEPGTQDWTVVTDQMIVSGKINDREFGTVYTVGDINYVRADGVSPFRLTYNAFLDTPAKDDYQIDYQLIDVALGVPGSEQQFTTKVPYSPLVSGQYYVPANTYERSVVGSGILQDMCTTGATRDHSAMWNYFYQCFSIPSSFDGQLMYVTPVAGVTAADEEIVYSKWESDVTHSAKIMPDAKPPVVTGLEYLSGKSVVNRDEPGFPSIFNVTASDALSGVKSLKVLVSNQSNGYSRTFEPDASGKVVLDFDSDSVLFEGDLIIRVEAVDNVGNEYAEVYGTEVFRLTTKLVNAYDTSTNVCRRNGAAILGFVTEGYAEMVEVELHDKLKGGNDTVQTRFVYTPPAFAKIENVIFGIPADCPDGTYQVVVKATKNGGSTVLVEYPELVVVGDADPSEIRIRIR